MSGQQRVEIFFVVPTGCGVRPRMHDSREVAVAARLESANLWLGGSVCSRPNYPVVLTCCSTCNNRELDRLVLHQQKIYNCLLSPVVQSPSAELGIFGVVRSSITCAAAKMAVVITGDHSEGLSATVVGEGVVGATVSAILSAAPR